MWFHDLRCCNLQGKRVGCLAEVLLIYALACELGISFPLCSRQPSHLMVECHRDGYDGNLDGYDGNASVLPNVHLIIKNS